MAKGFACVAVLACAIALGAQEANGPSGDDLSQLTLDELIERLPPVGSEWVDVERDELVPAALEFRERIEHGAALTAEQWRRVLLGTGVLRLRDRWPASQPFALSMRKAGWLRLTAIRLDPHEDRLAAVGAGWKNGHGYCGTHTVRVERDWLYQPLGFLPLGRHSLVFDLTLERGRVRRGQLPAEFEAPAGTFFDGVITFDIEIVATLDEAIPPRSSAELDSAVGRSLSLAFDDWSDGRTAILVADVNVAGDPRLAHLGLSLAFEVLHGSEVVEVHHLVAADHDPPASGISVPAGPRQPFAFCALRSLSPDVENDAEARAGWSVRVTGTSEHVEALWSADSRWNGTLVLSLDELIAREGEIAPQGRGPWWSYEPVFR